MPKQLESDTEQFVTVRMDRDLVARLSVECDRRTIGRAYAIQRAVEEWLDNHEGQDK